MSLYQDRQIKGFLLFLTLFALLFVGTATVLTYLSGERCGSPMAQT